MINQFLEGLGSNYELVAQKAVLTILQDHLNLPETTLRKHLSDQSKIQTAVRSYNVDWVYKDNSHLFLFECKFRDGYPCSDTYVRAFWTWCHDIQSYYYDMNVYGIFLTNTIFYDATIRYVLLTPYANNKKLALYTVSTGLDEPYCILLENCSRTNTELVVAINNCGNNIIPDELLSFEEMISSSLTHFVANSNHRLSIVKPILEGIKDFAALETLTNALLHKNYIQESLAFSSIILEKLTSLIDKRNSIDVIEKALEIYAVNLLSLQTVYSKRNRTLPKKDLRYSIKLVEHDWPYPTPNAIASICHALTIELARLGNIDDAIKYSNLAENIYRQREEVVKWTDSLYLLKTNEFALADAHLLCNNFNAAELIIETMSESIGHFSAHRHQIAAHQNVFRLNFMKNLIRYGQSSDLTRESYNNLATFRKTAGLGIW